jgi:ribosomal protein L19E
VTIAKKAVKSGKVTSEEEARKAGSELVKRLMPTIVFSLLSAGKIDKNRTGDPEYVWSVVLENGEMYNDWQAVHVIDEEFVVAANEAAKAGRLLVAVVLIATAVEHKINLFFRFLLHEKSGLDREEVTQAIRTNLESKIGWLFLLATGTELPDEIRKRIYQLQQWRNGLVHYKAVPYHINDDDYLSARICSEVKESGLEKMLSLPMDLERELARVTKEIVPLLSESENLAVSMFSQNGPDASKLRKTTRSAEKGKHQGAGSREKTSRRRANAGAETETQLALARSKPKQTKR